MIKKLSILTTMLLLIFCVLVGCAPKGYVKNGNNPLGGLWMYINAQFPELNLDLQKNKKQHYFLYKDELYYIESSGVSSDFMSCFNDYTVFIATSEEQIGSLADIPLTEKEVRYCDNIFLHEDYLYYQYRISREVFAFNHQGFDSYSKFVYYRFNLETGENNEVGFDDFLSRLQIVVSQKK